MTPATNRVRTYSATSCCRGAVVVVLAGTLAMTGCAPPITADSAQQEALRAAVVSQASNSTTADPAVAAPAPRPARQLTPLRDIDQVWYEATASAHGSVVSQGSGKPLTLAYDAFGGAVQAQWTVRMMLTSGDALTSWSQDVLGGVADAAIIAVQGYDYAGSPFPDPMTATFGPAPNLLVGAGGSSLAAAVTPGSYTLVEFVLTYNFDGTDTGTRSLSTLVGAQGWTVEGVAEPPLVQFGDNTAVMAAPGAVVEKPVIILTPLNQPPTVTCPGDLTVECDGQGNVAQLQAWLASATVDSHCPNLTFSNDFSALSDECGATGSATVQWTARDACGTATCTATFHIIDTTPPEITPPPDLTIECDGASQQAEIEAWLASATANDACGSATLVNDFTGLTDGCGATGSATVTWTAEDECGLTSTASAKVAIVDTMAPVLTPPADLTVECDGTGNQAELQAWLTSATATDTCGSVTITNDFTGLSDPCGGAGFAIVTWTAEDECGTKSTASAKFTIADTSAPVITLNGAAEMTLECGVAPYIELGAVAADVCDPNVPVVVGGDVVNTHAPGTYIVTYDATDACGNTALQVTRTVVVVDTTPPKVIVSEMIELWPPNHQYQVLTLADCNVRVKDACEGELDVNTVGRILSIYSDEPEDATGEGDGHTKADIVILGPSTFKLRVERQGGGNGRVYGIHFVVADSTGNTSEAMCFVGVPHDQSGNGPIDDGPNAGYTVTP